MNLPPVIAALHLPPFPGSRHPGRRSLNEIVEYALRNTQTAYDAGVRGLCLQDLGDTPVAPQVQPHITAGMAVVGAAVRSAFPDLTLGLCLMSHGGREPLAVAQAVGAQFVRLKVYVGVMVKAEGLLQGCAYEAVQYRSQIDAEGIAILADVHDRTGSPLGHLSLAEETKWAATFGRADGLILTGQSFDETLSMLAEVGGQKLGVPLLVGGGVTEQNAAQALQSAQSLIVGSAFKTTGGWTKEALQADWDSGKIRAFLRAAGL